MAGKWIECVPNFSEGRDTSKVQEIADAVESAGGYMLDIHMDPDHNRSVITFAAEAGIVVEAAFRAAERAVSLIDLSGHVGVHPRIGSADVVPFVPLEDSDIQDCVEAARNLGERLANELRLPVYFYERAALRDEFRNLANLRKLYLKALGEAGEGFLPPDLGPSRPHPTAGSVAVGARRPLVAFNCYISPANLKTAERIATRTRERSGGPTGVKALGLLLESAGEVQVSMNVTDVLNGPPHAAVERVNMLAKSEGAEITHSELVGLIPLDSVLRAAASALKLPSLRPEQVLELAILNRKELTE